MSAHDSYKELHQASHEASQTNQQAAQQKQMDLVRDRFTRTATVFSDFALVDRTVEAERLLKLIAPSGNERALDVACGPGTLARIFAKHVRWIAGLDLTPAMLERARKDAIANHLNNFRPLRGNALGMPFRDATFDIVITSYSIHHLPDPVVAIQEIARILKPGGKFGLLDMVVSEDASRAAACNHIEWVRDPSHTRALPLSGFERLLTSSGFDVKARGTEDHPRSLDVWMRTAGWKRGDAVYEDVRRLLEASIPGDTAGLRPRVLASPKESATGNDSRPDMELLHTAAFIVAQKQ
ncbi:MAG TPA: methyltransferase domain-containing protein [Candidatus Acidoferrales bacterium]|nr:methyltransferase domain-containing protein [Candidatus Acidoferrales bacterium]